MAKVHRVACLSRFRVRVVVGATLAWLGTSVVWAGVGAIDQLRAFAAKTPTARGEFTQKQMRSDGRLAPPARGRFAFARPGRFRWEVWAPYEQLVVADGVRAQFYDKDLKQVTVRKMTEAMAATPAAILFGSNDWQAAFVLKELGQLEGVDWLEAIPKAKDAGFEWIRIGLRGGLPASMEVRDPFGQVTRFEFTSIERNGGSDPALYRFEAPPGVEVVQ